MKNSLEGQNSRSKLTKKKISKLEDRFLQSKEQKKKRIKINRASEISGTPLHTAIYT